MASQSARDAASPLTAAVARKSKATKPANSNGESEIVILPPLDGDTVQQSLTTRECVTSSPPANQCGY